MNKYLKQLIEARKKKLAEISGLMTKALDAGETPDEESESEIAQLEADIAEIDKNIERVKAQLQAIKDAEDEGVEPAVDNTDVTKKVKSKALKKGEVVAIAIKALAASRKNSTSVNEVLKSWNAPKEVVDFVAQKAVNTTTTLAPIVQEHTAEFVELLRPKTILGKLTGFVEVPFNTKVPVQTAGSNVNWVGEGKLKPNGGISITQVEIKHSKVAGIVVLSDEVVRMSTPKADAIVMNTLQKDIAKFLDEALLDSTKAETDDSPASLTNGVDPIASTGQTAAAFEADLNAAIEEFIEAGDSIDGAQWVMSELLASRISQVRDGLGNKYFDGMNVGGAEKTLLGLPVVTSQSAANMIALIKPENIALADEDQIEYDTSNQATVTIDGTLTSLFENNLTAIRAERFIRWKIIRKACAWIKYTPAE